VRRLVPIVALLVTGAAAILADTRWWQPSPAQSAARGGEVAIPVMSDKARRADVPIFLAGLGTVQAFNSVLIKSRVDGQIVKIEFEEGKDVHAGDVLIEIDRAPFPAGAVAGWDLHPLESATFARRTPKADSERRDGPRPKAELGQASASNNSCKAVLTGLGSVRLRKCAPPSTRTKPRQSATPLAISSPWEGV
jgi:hypothetical protein